MHNLAQQINILYSKRDILKNDQELLLSAKNLSEEVLSLLNTGKVRVAEQGINNAWHVNEWIKQAIQLYFISHTPSLLKLSECDSAYDKIPLKTAKWTEANYAEAKFRMSVGAVVRKGAYVASGCVLMPSFINIGAYVGEGTLIDTWATVGSCAQLGKNCHISGGVGIGGVLEPISARPVIIEDNVFIGARSEIAEGVIVREGAVLSMGVYIGSSTKIINRATGEIVYGEVPANSVVVPGTFPSSNGAHLYAAIIVKQVDAQTRNKVGINEILRDVD
jgi:2,3,4,5-tetrahydropyridine-2,6-dicarboxylate N-succinyltransferase